MRQDTLDILSSEVVAVKRAKISDLNPETCIQPPNVAAEFQLACGQSWFGFIKEENYIFVPNPKGNQLKDIVKIGWKKEHLFPLSTMVAKCQVKPECEQTDTMAYENYLNNNSIPLLKMAQRVDMKLRQIENYQFASLSGEDVQGSLKKATVDLKRLLTLGSAKERV